jgi:hypothetical protein
MLAAPWIKRIDLLTGECRAMALDPATPFVTSINETQAFHEAYQFDGQSWFHVTRGNRVWAMHGTAASSGSALYLFMEYPEARHPELEAALANDADALGPYADWLEEQGDPYAAALKPQLLKERGPAGRWFLEGLDRSGAVAFTLRDALVREVKVATLSDRLLPTLHHLVHLRACVALKKVTIDPRALGTVVGGDLGAWTMWRDVRWPRSLETLALPKVSAEARAAVEKAAGVRVTAK